MTTPVRVIEAPDWADPVESYVTDLTSARAPFFEEYDETETVWRSSNASPNSRALAHLERTDTRRSIEPHFELGTTDGVLGLAVTYRDLICVPTAADARALAEAATALAVMLDDVERRTRR